MKLILTVIGCVLAGASFAASGRPAAGASPTADPKGPMFRCEFADGSVVTGIFTGERLSVRTPYGSLELDPATLRKIEQISVTGPAAPTARAKDATVFLVLDLRDGTRVRGKTKLDAFAVTWRYGKLSVPLADIRTITIEQVSAKGETWQKAALEMCNGDKLTGQPAVSKLDVDTAYGKLSVPLADVAKIEVSALQPGAVQPAGLVLHYAFDEKSDKVADKSGRGSHGTVHGATWTAKGKVGGAYDFDGKDDYIELGPSSLYKSKGQLSACAWVYIRDQVAIVLSNYHGGNAYNGQFFFSCDDVGGMDALFGQGPNKYVRYISNARSIPANEWHHVAFSYDESRGNGNKIKLYLDGEEMGGYKIQSEGNGGPVLDIAENLRIMAHRDTPTGTLSDGLIDEVMIFDRALSAEEIQRIYSSAGAGAVLHFAFDTDEGTKATDKSGRGNHGTVRGATWTAKGKVGGAYQFDGRDDQIESGKNTGVEGASPRTLAAWIRCDDIPAGKSMVPVGFGESNSYANPSCSGTLFSIMVHCVGGTKTIGMWGVNNGDVWSPTPFSTGRWCHVAATYDGNTVHLYLDGKLDVCKKVSLATPPSHLFLARVWGDYPDRVPFQGAVDKVMLYDRALSVEEIRRLYQQGCKAP